MGRGDSESTAAVVALISEAEVAQWRSLTVASPKTEPSAEEKEVLRAKKEAEKKGKNGLVEDILSRGVALKKDKLRKLLDQLASKQEEREASEATRPSWLDPPSGTRDFHPVDMRLKNWLFAQMKASSLRFGFQEYDAPVLEHVELYERKAGEEISQQMYNFTDKENTRVTLRPEMTPSLARMVLNLTNLATGEVRSPLPLKWFSIPQCWRFEATQRGRKREHYQWNVDIVGEKSVTAEVELLNVVCDFFKNVGVTPEIVGVRVNSRRVLDAAMRSAGVSSENFAKVCVIVDKIDKIGPAAVEALLTEDNLVEKAAALKILECLKAKSIDDLADTVDDQEAIEEMRTLFILAKEAGFGDYLVFDASVVRGLAYYTGVVFEAFDRKGELRAICGGGRYDRLLALYGGDKCQIPCCGFGFGDCVVVELLKDYGLLPQFSASVDFVVAPFSKSEIPAAFKVAARLRNNGYSVDLALEARKARQAFDLANRAGARRVAFVGPDEFRQGNVRIKDMLIKDPSTGEGLQKDIPLTDFHNIETHFPGNESAPAPMIMASKETIQRPTVALADNWALNPTARFAVLGKQDL